MSATKSLPRRRPISEIAIDRGRVLGSGTDAHVFEGMLKAHTGPRNNWPDTPVAVKEVRAPRNVDEEKQFAREFETLQKLSDIAHPTLTGLISCSFATFQIVMERFRVSLDQVISRNMEWEHEGKLVQWNATTKSICLLGVAVALKISHAQNVMHRDLKPGNVMMDDYMHPHVSDFGRARFYSQEVGEQLATTMDMGSPMYMAPEMVDSEGYTEAVDVYSFGVMMNEIISGQTPHNECTTLFALLRDVRNGKRPDLDETHSLAPLIKECWDENPSKRPSMEEIAKQGAQGLFKLPGCDETEWQQYKRLIGVP